MPPLQPQLYQKMQVVINLMYFVSSNHRWAWPWLQRVLSAVWRDCWTSPRTIHPNGKQLAWIRSLRPPDSRSASGPYAPPPSPTRANRLPEWDPTSCLNAARGRRLTGPSTHTQNSNTPARYSYQCHWYWNKYYKYCLYCDAYWC